MEERKRPSRIVSKPLRYRVSVEDSNGVLIPTKRKSTTKMMQYKEPKKGSSDSFKNGKYLNAAGNEIINIGHCSPLVEPKEEPLDDFLWNPAENEINDEYSLSQNDCKKEEMIEDEEILNLPPPSSPVKVGPIVDDYIQDLVRLGQIQAWDARLDQSARYGISPTYPVELKTEDIKEETASIKDELAIFDDVVDQSSSIVEDKYEATDRGYIAKEKSLDLSKEEGIRCSRRVTLKQKFIDSIEDSDDEDIMPLCDLSQMFKSDSLSEAQRENFMEIRRTDQSNIAVRNSHHRCKYRTMINATDLNCPLCSYFTRTVPAWYSHLRTSHFTTPTQVGIALRCGCNHVFFSAYHSRVCDYANTTLLERIFRSQRVKVGNSLFTNTGQEIIDSKCQSKHRIA